MSLPLANVVCEGYVFTGVCLSTGGGWYLSMYCMWYPSMPCSGSLGVGGVVSQHAVQVSRPTAKGEVEGDLSGPGPQPRGKLRGVWSRPTPKGEVEGDLARGCLLWGCLLWGGPAPGGCLLWEVLALEGGACSMGVEDPPWWLLLRAVRIQLEWILVFFIYNHTANHNWKFWVALSLYYWCYLFHLIRQNKLIVMERSWELPLDDTPLIVWINQFDKNLSNWKVRKAAKEKSTTSHMVLQ